MGLFRFLREWKEKADGTLTGPALETESVKTGTITIRDGEISTSGGSPVKIDSTGLRLDTGQSIEDVGGDSRFEITSNRTKVLDSSGRNAAQYVDGSANQFEAYSSTPVRIQDNSGSFTAIEYTTSSTSPGALSLPNAELDAQNGAVVSGSDLTFGANTDIDLGGTSLITGLTPDANLVQSEGAIQATLSSSQGTASGNIKLFSITDDTEGKIVYRRNASPSDPEALELNNQTEGRSLFVVNDSGRVRIPNGDLRLATGQSIEDGTGQGRLRLQSSQTQLVDEDGNQAVTVNGGSNLTLQATATSPVRVQDKEGFFTAVEYTTSASSPGTLSLDNAFLQTEVRGFNKAGVGSNGISLSSQPGVEESTGLSFTADSDGDGSFGYGKLFYKDSTGELIAEVNGTQTVLAS